MAEDQIGTRKDHVREAFQFTKIFSTFRVALDPKKLLLAAAGILVMAFGWWLLSVLFYGSRHEPKPSDYKKADYLGPDITEEEAQRRSDEDYQRDHRKFLLLQAVAGPNGSMRKWPWVEDRGPNPYLELEHAIVARTRQEDGTTGAESLQPRQVLVLIEPLVKFLTPVVYLFHPDAGFWNRVYFLLVILWTLATWALFGAAITRMAAVQFARNDKIGMTEALRFAWSRYLHFFSAPLIPLVVIAFLTILLAIFGFFQVFTVFIGDIIIAGLFWPLVILFGLGMAVVLVGLIGWPLMYSTISAEGSDNFDALSRSYSYVYQVPWYYLWYCLVAVVYGVVVVFFVGLMGSLMVYLGKWGVSQAPFASAVDREPDYLFVYAPTSFHWRDLLLEGSSAVYSVAEVRKVGSRAYIARLEEELKTEKSRNTIAADIRRDIRTGRLDPGDVRQPVTEISKPIREEIKRDNFRPGHVRQDYWDSFRFWNYIGAWLVAFWLGLVFMLIVGFGYSYFWCGSVIIYLLMRRKVDDTELDEVYLGEDDLEEPYTPPATTTTGTTPPVKPTGGPGLIAPESLTLRTAPAAGDQTPTPKEPTAEPRAGAGAPIAPPGPKAPPLTPSPKVTTLAPPSSLPEPPSKVTTLAPPSSLPEPPPEPPHETASTPPPSPPEPFHEPPRTGTSEPHPPAEGTKSNGPTEP